MIIAPGAGTYTFQLTYSDATGASSTDSMTLTVQSVSGTTRYVDGNLSGNCSGSTYSISGRNCSGSDGPGYQTIQAAADAVSPGDTVLVRSGTYTDALAGDIYIYVCHNTVSGTVTRPISFKPYNNEPVVITSAGSFSDDDTGPPNHYAVGPIPPAGNYRETLWQIDADYIQISGFELTGAVGEGLRIDHGNYNFISDCISHDNWDTSFGAKFVDSGTFVGNVLYHCEAYRTRRNGGFVWPEINSADPGYWKNNAVVECLAHDQGYQPDGQQVLPYGTGDPYGGGNSGGIMQSKEVADADPTGAINYGDWNFFVGNISWHNTADGFPVESGSFYENDISFYNTQTNRNVPWCPTCPKTCDAFKLHRPSENAVLRGCIGYSCSGRGLELRVLDGAISYFFNNTVAGMANEDGVDAGDISQYLVENTLGLNNPEGDIIVANQTFSNKNWSKDNTAPLHGIPQVSNETPAINFDYPESSTVNAKRLYILSQFKSAFTPSPGSPLVNAGILIPGYHCSTADDSPNPPDPNDPRVHWWGVGPTIGAFQYNPNAVQQIPPNPPQHLHVDP